MNISTIGVPVSLYLMFITYIFIVIIFYKQTKKIKSISLNFCVCMFEFISPRTLPQSNLARANRPHTTLSWACPVPGWKSLPATSNWPTYTMYIGGWPGTIICNVVGYQSQRWDRIFESSAPALHDGSFNTSTHPINPLMCIPDRVVSISTGTFYFESRVTACLYLMD